MLLTGAVELPGPVVVELLWALTETASSDSAAARVSHILGTGGLMMVEDQCIVDTKILIRESASYQVLYCTYTKDKPSKVNESYKLSRSMRKKKSSLSVEVECMARAPYKKIVHRVSSIRQLPPPKPRTHTALLNIAVATSRIIITLATCFSSLYVVITEYYPTYSVQSSLRAIMRGSQEPGYTRARVLSCNYLMT